MGAIETDGPEEVTEVAQEVDRAEVADQVRKTIDARIESDRGALSSGKGYQSPEFKRVRRNLQGQTERDKARKAACLTAQEGCKKNKEI